MVLIDLDDTQLDYQWKKPRALAAAAHSAGIAPGDLANAVASCPPPSWEFGGSRMHHALAACGCGAIPAAEAACGRESLACTRPLPGARRLLQARLATDALVVVATHGQETMQRAAWGTSWPASCPTPAS